MKALPPALLLLLLVAPLAGAQTPPQLAPCGPLSIPAEPVPPAQAIGPGERVQVFVTVALGGRLPATVTVAATTTTPGWSVVESPPAAQVQPESTADFRFTIEAGEGADANGLVQFAASGACDSPLGANCPGNACNAGSANAQVSVPYRAPQGFWLPGLDNLAFGVEYLIAAIVLVGLATVIPFAMRRKKGGLHAQCPEPLKLVKPGLGASFPIEVRNEGREGAKAQLEIGPVPEGWSAFAPLPELQLAPKELRSLWLMVRSPPEAREGDAVEVELRLRDAAGAASTVRVRAEVQA